MKILFGRRNSKLATFESKEIDYEGVGKEQLNFELYVSYFHIYFIPFFPLDMSWKVVDKSSKNEIVETTAELRHAMTLRELKTKKPLWTFSGLFFCGLVIATLIVVPIGRKLSWEYELMRDDSAFREKISEFILAPVYGDIYVFSMTKLNSKVDKWGTKRYVPGLGATLRYMVIDDEEGGITFKLLGHDLFRSSEIVPADIVTINKEALTTAAESHLPSIFWESMRERSRLPQKVSGVRIPDVVDEALFGLKGIRRGEMVAGSPGEPEER